MSRHRGTSGPRLALALVLLLAWAAGCAAPYILHLAHGQARILLESRPIEEVIANPTTGAAVGAKLVLIQRVKRFGEEVLGLKADTSFTTFAPVEGRALLHILTAAPKTELKAHTWSFPLVGTFPYKGFFDRAMAEAEASRLAASGLDTHLRAATAYSTLGWFTDPVFEPLLRLPDAVIANVILHEKTHASVFVHDHLDFNEGLATFVGGEGSVEFFAAADGRGSPRHLEALGRKEDERRFGRFLKKVLADLRALYRSGLSRQEKLKRREEVFEASRAKLLAEGEKYHYKNLVELYTRARINNAFLLSLELYTVDVKTFVKAYERLDGDLAKTIAFFKTVGRKAEDPKGYVKRWLDEGGAPAAAKPRSML